MSPSTFAEWFRRIEGEHTEAGGLGTLVVEPVLATNLAGFQARRNADPAFRRLVSGHIVPVTQNASARYCLLAAGVVQSPYSTPITTLLQGDWCNRRSPIGGYETGGTIQARLSRSLARSGEMLVYPVTAEGVDNFFVEAAFYRRSVALTTLGRRSAATTGWVSSSFDIHALIASAIGDHRDVAVTLYHRNPGASVELMG